MVNNETAYPDLNCQQQWPRTVSTGFSHISMFTFALWYSGHHYMKNFIQQDKVCSGFMQV